MHVGPTGWRRALVVAVVLAASSMSQLSVNAQFPPANPDALVPPDQNPPAPSSPIVGLTSVLEYLDRILSALRTRPDSDVIELDGDIVPLQVVDNLEAARRYTQLALDAFLGTTRGGLHQTPGHVESAVLALQAIPVPPGTPAEALVDGLATRLALVSRQMALDLLIRARTGGVPLRILFLRLGDFLTGDWLLSAGNHGGAADRYGNAITVADQLHFDLDRLQLNLILAFENQSVGYSYAIAVNGQLQRTGSGGLGNNGLARTSADPPETSQSPTKEMNIASISKPITAVAILRLLEANGLDPDESISPYLPPSWTQGICVPAGQCSEDLTFRDLLTHRSGLDSNNNGPYDYAALRTYIEQGVNPAFKTFVYQNLNFALLARVLLPRLLGIDPEQSPNPPLSASGVYRLYVAGLLFQPIGVTADCLPNDAQQTLLYKFPYDNSTGINAGDWTLICGSGGWYLSAVELLNFFAHVRYNNGMLSPLARQQMDFGFLGWMSPSNYNFASGTFGTYRGHGGDLLYNPPALDKGVDTCVMNFPEEVQVSVLINSIGGGYPYQCQALKQAYEDAWIY